MILFLTTAGEHKLHVGTFPCRAVPSIGDTIDILVDDQKEAFRYICDSGHGRVYPNGVVANLKVTAVAWNFIDRGEISEEWETIEIEVEPNPLKSYQRS